MLRSRLFALALGVSVSLLPALSRAQAPDATALAEARERFDRGVKLFNQADHAGALAEFNRAFELTKNPVALYNVGLVSAALGKPVQAVEALDAVLASPGNLKPEQLARAKSTRDEQAARVGEIQLEVPVAGAAVEVDGVRVGKSPLSKPIQVAAGTRLLAVIAPGHVPFRKEVTLAGRQRVPVKAELVPTDRRLAELTVKSRLVGAGVYVDGHLVGHTPLPASLSLEPGARSVELRRPGYRSAARKVSLGEGTSGEVTLDPVEDLASASVRPGTLVVDVSETESTISVDGAPRKGALSGLRLAPGPHRLRVERAGFVEHERIVDVPEGTSSRVKVVLEPTPEYRDEYVSKAKTTRTLGWIGVATGAAATLAGVGYLVFNSKKIDEAEDKYRDIEYASEPNSKRRCDHFAVGVNIAACDAELDVRYEEWNDAKTRNTYGFIAAGAGVAIAATGVVLLMIADDPDRYEVAPTGELARRPRFTPGIWLSRDVKGAALTASF